MHAKLSMAALLLAATPMTSACATPASPPTVVTVSTEPLAKAKSQPITDTSAMTVSENSGATTKEAYIFQSPDEQFVVGVASYERVTLVIKDWPMDEYMHILSGKLEVVDSSGSHIYGPGQSFVMPKGFDGIWRVIEPVEKIAIAYLPK